MKIYGDTQSGNCYKLYLACELLKIDHEWVDVDILAGQTQSASFLAKSSNGKIPILELKNGQTLSESNAILNYLCEGSNWYPQDIWHRAKVHQWQFFEQYSHEPYIAVARFINKYLGMPADRKQEFIDKQKGGNKALRVMETQLAQTPFLTGEFPTAADISLFAYTHVAEEGGFDLSTYPAVLQWIQRITALNHFKPMPSS